MLVGNSEDCSCMLLTSQGFLAQSWHVSSHGVFAVSCIGVVLLVVALEFLRRVGRVYDQYLIAQFGRQASRRAFEASANDSPCTSSSAYQGYRYTPLQQLIRSIIHMTTFAVAYFIMLLAMYFNGFIIISIFIGALLGKFLCDWQTVKVPVSSTATRRAEETQELAKGEQDLTYCCG